MEGVVEVKNKYEAELMSIRGVVGVFADVENNKIVVLVESPTVCANIPSRIEGFPVECRVTGRISGL